MQLHTGSYFKLMLGFGDMLHITKYEISAGINEVSRLFISHALNSEYKLICSCLPLHKPLP